MKTFEEWYNSFNEGTQYELRGICEWIYLDNNDNLKFKQFGLSTDKGQLMVELKTRRTYARSDIIVNSFCTLIAAAIKGEITLFDNDPDMLFEAAKRAYADNSDFLFLLSLDKAREFLTRLNIEHDGALELGTLLLCTEDFDNIDFSKLKKDSYIAPKLMPIFGEAKCYEYFKENPIYIDPLTDHKLGDTVDRLFFGEDGWNSVQKKKFIDRLYRGSAMWKVRDFMERFVTVDKSCLKYLGTIIEGDPSLADKLYYEKKSDDEINANDPGYMTFRYPKEIRKLFQIAGCCARRTIPKTRAQKCGDIAALLKFYNFDFDKIFDAMYPEYIEKPEVQAELTA